MKKIAFILIPLILLSVVSCRHDKLLSDVSSESAKIFEYSVEYIDESTGLTSYSTGTYEESEPYGCSFIVDEVIKLSGANTSAVCSYEEGILTVDFDKSFFLSVENTPELESSILLAIHRNIPYHFPEVEKIVFLTNGCPFDSNFHSFPKDTPFSPEMLEALKEKIVCDYTISYYDIVQDASLEYSDTEVFYGEIDPVFFVNKVCELYGVYTECNGVKVSDSVMTVDFTSGYAPLAGTGSYVEAKILESVADILLSQFPDISAIAYTADGGREYNSGHVYFEPGDIFKAR